MKEPTSEFMNFPARAALFYFAGAVGCWLAFSETETPPHFWPVVGFELGAVIGLSAIGAAAYAFMRSVVADEWPALSLAAPGAVLLITGGFGRVFSNDIAFQIGVVTAFAAVAVVLCRLGLLLIRGRV